MRKVEPKMHREFTKQTLAVATQSQQLVIYMFLSLGQTGNGFIMKLFQKFCEYAH